MKLVSIIMSTYNENEYELRKSIESILNQTYKNLEFIITASNPTNTTIRNILMEYKKKDVRLKLFFETRSISLALSLNKAIKQAKGCYIARMDADDISFPNRIEKQVAFIEENNFDMIATNKVIIDEEGIVLNDNCMVVKNPITIKRVLRYGNVITHPSVLIKKSVLEELKGYRNLESSEDYELWLRMNSNHYKIAILEEKLLYYRIRKNSLMRRNLFRQYLCDKYIKNLYQQRIKFGKDDYSPKNLQNFLEENQLYHTEKEEKFNAMHENLQRAIEMIKERKIWRGGKKLLAIILTNRQGADIISNMIKYKIAKLF